MKDILIVFEKEITIKENVENNLELFDELQTLITGIDNAKNFAKIGGVFFLLGHAVNCDIPDTLREQALIILTDCSANNEFV